jgi:hypothetical protein
MIPYKKYLVTATEKRYNMFTAPAAAEMDLLCLLSKFLSSTTDMNSIKTDKTMMYIFLFSIKRTDTTKVAINIDFAVLNPSSSLCRFSGMLPSRSDLRSSRLSLGSGDLKYNNIFSSDITNNIMKLRIRYKDVLSANRSNGIKMMTTLIKTDIFVSI